MWVMVNANCRFSFSCIFDFIMALSLINFYLSTHVLSFKATIYLFLTQKVISNILQLYTAETTLWSCGRLESGWLQLFLHWSFSKICPLIHERCWVMNDFAVICQRNKLIAKQAKQNRSCSQKWIATYN